MAGMVPGRLPFRKSARGPLTRADSRLLDMLKRILESVWIVRLARILLGALFIYASIDKLRHPLEFARIIAAYQILPNKAAAVLAAVLPFLELICGILLIVGVWVVPALTWTGVLLLTFLFGVVQAYARGLAIDCGCFSVGGGSSAITAWTIVRDVLFLLVWARVFWHYQGLPGSV